MTKIGELILKGSLKKGRIITRVEKKMIVDKKKIQGRRRVWAHVKSF